MSMSATSVDHTLRAVADPTRRAILKLLRDDEVPAGAIARNFDGISRPAVSQHLQVLVNAELVDVRKLGRQRLYRFRPGRLEEAADVFDDLWIGRLERLRVVAEALDASGET